MKLAWPHVHAAASSSIKRVPSVLATGTLAPSHPPLAFPPAPLGELRGALRGHAPIVVLTIVAISLGIFLAAQLQTPARRDGTTPEYRREVAAATIQRLEAEQAELKRRIADLRRAIAGEQAALAAATGNIGDITAALETQKVIAGMIALRGPGLRIVLDDSPVTQIPAKEDPSLYIVHEYQLRDVVNILWGAGAEAISINGERLVEHSSIYCVGSTILVNNVRMSPPFEFLVIGDPDSLAAAVHAPENLKSLKTRVKVYNVQLQIARQREVTIPAYTGRLEIRHAAPAVDDAIASRRAASP